MSEQVESWLRYLQSDPNSIAADNRRTQNEASGLRDAPLSLLSYEEMKQLVGRLAELPTDLPHVIPRVNEFLHRAVRQWPGPGKRLSETDVLTERLAALYLAWRDTQVERHRVLSWLALLGSEAAWRQLAELMAVDPPTGEREAIEAVVPLWRSSSGPFFALFPRILDAVSHPHVAAMVLDLSNYLVRMRRLSAHPGLDRAEAWTRLLGQVVERLEMLEEESRRSGVSDLNVARQVVDAIALAISLTDTLSLLEHRDAIGKWYRLLGLEHRRLRVEAAAALAKFGEPVGVEALQKLVAEPSVRLRVLHYADELGMSDQLPAEYRTARALAEAQMMVRLAEPDLFGVPPIECELVDERTWVWPGEEEPQECFLFRYRYGAEPDEWTNLAMAGPVCHALSADLTALPTPLVYAAYAGVSVEHPDLRRVPLDQLTGAQAAQVQLAVRRLADAGFHSVEPRFVGAIFENWVLVASAHRQGQQGTLIVDRQGVWQWFVQEHRRGVDVDTAYAIYVGCELLSQFNPEFRLAATDEPVDEDTTSADAN